MCLIRFRSLELLAILIYLILSFNKVTDPIYLFNSKKLLINRIKNMTFLAASHAAIYSALVNNKTTHCCRFKFHEMGEPYIINTYPIIDFLITGLPSQLESTYLCSPRSLFR
jgi:hypothetical protein